MASVLQLRKIPSLYWSLKHRHAMQAFGWQSVSYLKLCYIMKRLKSSAKTPTDIHAHDPACHSQEYNSLSDTIKEGVASKAPDDSEELESLSDPSKCTKNLVNQCNSNNNADIAILSAKEVLESVRNELYEDGGRSVSAGQCSMSKSVLSFGENMNVGHKQYKKFSDTKKISVIANKTARKTKVVRNYYSKVQDSNDLSKKYKTEEKNPKLVITDESAANRNSDQHKSLSEHCVEVGSVRNEKQFVNGSSATVKKTVKITTVFNTTKTSSLVATPDSSTRCENSLGIQTLTHSLHQQIFGRVKPKEVKEAKEDFQRSKEHLQTHGLWGKKPSILPDIELQIPELEGGDLDRHFIIIAEEQCAPYKHLLNHLIGTDLPCIPGTWEFSPGWTRYNSDGSCTKVEFPECDAIVFDVEVCVQEGNLPTLATAVSDKYWYSWCSDRLIHPEAQLDDNISSKDLIPLETAHFTAAADEKLGNPRIVVGHNVSYDRIRVREQYHIEGSSLRFVDTMSLHIAVSGLVSEQRSLLLKNKTSDKKIFLPWMNVGCQNNLNDVYKFYCRPKDDLKKSTRDVFVKGSICDVREDFQNLMKYCASDVKATHMVLSKLLPKFFEHCPHPVTFSGMLEMGMTFLPVMQNWNKYVEAAELEYHRAQRSLNEKLAAEARAALCYLDGKRYEEDPWLWDLDWSLPKGRVRKLPGYPNWYRKLCQRAGEREGTPEPENMSTSQQVVPKLLRLTWNGYPLNYVRKYGWGYLKPLYQSVDQIPISEMPSVDCGDKDMSLFPVKALYEMCFDKDTKTEHQGELKGHEDASLNLEENYEWVSRKDVPENGHTCKNSINQEENAVDIGIPGVAFFQLPHKNGVGNRVGNPLAKDFLTKIEDKTLSSHIGDIAELVLKTSKSISYWKNNRDRILSQMVVWADHSSLPSIITSDSDYDKNDKYGIILPMVITAGTITRRAVERTWMTASNAYVDRIGSELKAMIEAPPGYKFVGADVDSEELWIAALLGDSYLSAEHGATALGWMTLQGKKSDGTDMHSRTANSAGISRDHAKIINYGRIYGAGVRFFQRLLKQFNPSLSGAETKERAEKLFATTKGQKGWYLNYKGEQLTDCINYLRNEKPLTRKAIYSMLKVARHENMDFTFAEIVKMPPVWVGGSESHTFNCLEAIARSETPKTPVLGASITRALEPFLVDDEFITSRVNWVVQSSAVDYLHLLLVCMRWLFSKYEISGRFCISIHDEVRYMVPSEDCYRAALALQIANLLTRSLFALKLGFKDLPQSVAFFSGIDIDKVLRKEPHLDCITPSNPDGLMKGYGIPPGVTLDIQQILHATNGMLIKPDNESSDRKTIKCL